MMITGMPRIALAAEDFQGLVSTFRDKLAMPVTDLNLLGIDTFGASLAMCTPGGGSNIELMAPDDAATPLSQSLQGFLDRRGAGPFALMLEADDPNAEADELLGRGLSVMPLMAGAAGRDIHPKSNHGVLIRVYPTNSVTGLGDELPQGPEPTGLSGIERVIIAVRDIDVAADTFGRKFALPTSAPIRDAPRGTCSVICSPPKGGVIELVAAVDTNKTFAAAIERFIAARREGLYALVLGSKDLQMTAKALATNGLATKPVPGLENTLELDSSATFGARFFVQCNH